MNWQGLQDQFRQQHSKIGNMPEQLFHVWRSFNYDENTETVDAFVTRIQQVVVLLGYEEWQILEVFKNTLLNRLYWVLFPIEDLRQAVATVKRIFTKNKIDRQLSGQSNASAPFMKASESHISSHKKAVLFNTLESTDNKIDRLKSSLNKMNVKMDRGDAQFKPQIYQRRRREQNRCKYNQNDFWTKNRPFSTDRQTFMEVEVESGVIHVENMITLLVTVLM